MNVTLVRFSNGFLAGATTEDREKLRAWKAGEAVRVKLAGKPRNYKHHAKFMSCVSFIAETHPTFRKFHSQAPLLYFLKEQTGHFDFYTMANGDVIKVPRSISFDEMDEGEFIAWSGEAKKVMAELLMHVPKAYEREAADWIAWCVG